MQIVSMCRAFADVVVNLSERELNQIGLRVGDDIRLELEDLRELRDAYIGQARLLAGGPAANTAAMLADLGAHSAFIGKVADDVLGDVFRNDFQRRGVTFKTAPVSGGVTACCMVFVTPEGERTFAYNPGVADQIDTQDVETYRTELAAADLVYISLTNKAPDCAASIERARQIARKARFVAGLQCHTPGDIELSQKILSYDVVLGNEFEFVGLVHDLGAGSLPKLAKLHPNKMFACTCGAGGAVIYQGEDVVKVPAQQVDIITDTAGAGDAWAAGFLYGLSAQNLPEQAGTLASSCAAEVLSVPGARKPAPN